MANKNQLKVGPGVETLNLVVEMFDWISPLVKRQETDYYQQA